MGGEKEIVRAFVAIELPSDIKEVLKKEVQSLEQRVSTPLKWVRPESVHLTLKFLGNVEQGRFPGILKNLNTVSHSISPFELSLSELGCFPTPRRARVLWVGLKGDLERLKRLQSQIEEGLKAQGFDGDKRAFSPHLTLARAKTTVDLEPVLWAYSTPEIYSTEKEMWTRPFVVKGFCLMKSQLLSTGAVYSSLGYVKLEETRLK